eukprot:Opistho-2@31649
MFTAGTARVILLCAVRHLGDGCMRENLLLRLDDLRGGLLRLQHKHRVPPKQRALVREQCFYNARLVLHVQDRLRKASRRPHDVRPPHNAQILRVHLRFVAFGNEAAQVLDEQAQRGKVRRRKAGKKARQALEERVARPARVRRPAVLHLRTVDKLGVERVRQQRIGQFPKVELGKRCNAVYVKTVGWIQVHTRFVGIKRSPQCLDLGRHARQSVDSAHHAPLLHLLKAPADDNRHARSTSLAVLGKVCPKHGIPQNARPPQDITRHLPIVEKAAQMRRKFAPRQFSDNCAGKGLRCLWPVRVRVQVWGTLWLGVFFRGRWSRTQRDWQAEGGAALCL